MQTNEIEHFEDWDFVDLKVPQTYKLMGYKEQPLAPSSSVCMYVFLYVCMYDVFHYVCMSSIMYVCIHEDAEEDFLIYTYMYIHIYMYVYIYIYTHTHIFNIHTSIHT